MYQETGSTGSIGLLRLISTNCAQKWSSHKPLSPTFDHHKIVKSRGKAQEESIEETDPHNLCTQGQKFNSTYSNGDSSLMAPYYFSY